MQDFLNFINQGWVGIVIGIIMTTIIYLISKKNQILACETKSLRLIGKEEQKLPQKIKIFFDDKVVERLTSTQIWIWNNGNETIEGTKIVVDDPIRYIFDNETKILSVKIITKTREVNKVKITSFVDNEIRLDFDFLDPKDGAKIEILHTGKKQNPKMAGTIKGMPKGIKFYSSLQKEKHKIEGNSLANLSKINSSWVILLIGIIMVIIGVLPDFLIVPVYDILNSKVPPKIQDFRLLFIISGLAYIFLPLILKYNGRKKYPEILDKDEEQKLKSE